LIVVGFGGYPALEWVLLAIALVSLGATWVATAERRK
jgi:hypothetical protein